MPVVIVLKENRAKEIIVQDAGGKTSVPFGLLMESPDAYFVVPPDKNQRGIELKKDSVEALVILNRK